MQTVLGLIGDTRKIDMDLLAGLEIIDRVTRITDPFKGLLNGTNRTID